jgi:anthranilate phosphoribosyltransferase
MIDVFKENLEQVLMKKDLSFENASMIMKEIMTGKIPSSRIAAFLIALRMKGESPEEIRAFASVMREYALKVPTDIPNLVDTCGTGGDAIKTFNISTISALIAASCGVPIAKHGNRAVSGTCGSADLLEALGVNINANVEDIKLALEQAHFGFMFAPAFHPAMKFVMPTRKELGVRTVFNILGPLTNPALAKGQILGVFSKDLVKPMAEVLSKLGIQKGFVFHSEPGIDEIVPISTVYLAEINGDKVSYSEKSAKEFNLQPITIDMIKGADIQTNTKIALEILSGKDKSIRSDIAILNAAYGILASGLANDLENAKQIAKDAIQNNKPIENLKKIIMLTKGDLKKFENLIGTL